MAGARAPRSSRTALGDASIAKTEFYRRAGLSERRWWVDQELVYAAGVPMHIINNDIGFAGLQHMAVAGSAEAEQFEDLTTELAAMTDPVEALQGAPHKVESRRRGNALRGFCPFCAAAA